MSNDGLRHLTLNARRRSARRNERKMPGGSRMAAKYDTLVLRNNKRRA